MTKNTNIILPNWKDIAKVLKFKEKDFNKLLENYIKVKKEIYTNIKSIKKENRNFENTVLAIENSGNDFTDTTYQIGVYSITHKDKAYRDMADNFQKEMSEKITDIEYDKDIYLAFMDYYNGNYKKEKKNLDKVYGVGSVKLVEDGYKGYKRMGFDLPKAKQDKLKNNIKSLSKLSLDFGKNIYEYKDFILCNEEEIKGLPDNFIKTLSKENDKYKITLDYPDSTPFLQYAYSREKRKELSYKISQKGGKINLQILSEMTNLRKENAKLLGYKDYLDFSTQNRMSKSGEKVFNFLKPLLKKTKPIAAKELDILNSFAKENLEQYKNIKEIESYDLSYVSNKFKENKYSYDSSKLKEYFELEHTLKVMFDIFGNLFNFVVEEVIGKEERGILPDSKVRLYTLKNKSNKKLLSYFILDLFPREGKYSHAGHSRFTTNIKAVPIDILICNFQSPNKKTPSLLGLREVETLFHEFGHGLHCMLSHTAHFSQNGTNCDHDFVEVPSQFMEEFLFEKENLKKLAVHYKTNKNLDINTIDKIISAKNFMISTTYIRQFIMAFFDAKLHSDKVSLKNKGLDIAKEFTKIGAEFNKIKTIKDSLFPADWIHMDGSYAGGYYSYMWALVYADDFYSVFKEAGNDKKKLKEIGERYRKEILEVGGSRDESVSVKKFLGRNSNNKAFLENLI